MSPVGRIVAIVLVAVIAITGIAVVALGLSGAAGIGARPSASADASASTTDRATDRPSPTGPTPTGSADEAALVRTLREIEEQVVAIRGLEPADIGDPDIITRAELADELQALFDADYPPEERERDNHVLRALGLLRADEDVAALQLELLGEQVLGFYDDVERRMVVVTDSGLDAEAKLTYAHEYTHALQDAAFGLDSLETDAEGEDDRSLARTSLIEGDATVTMLAWALAHLSPEELMEIGGGAVVPETGDVPAWMLNQLQFPYTTGLSWVGAIAGDPLSPDFTAVDAAYDDPPASTEQILDPTLEAWRTREAPLDVAVPPFAAELGADWEAIETTSLGEAMIGIILEYFGTDRATALDAAGGWGGDEVVVAIGPDDAFAVGWRLRWDTAADAEEFVAAYEPASGDLPFVVEIRSVADDEVLVVHGSSEDVARRVADAAD
jgi:hypothetical protein